MKNTFFIFVLSAANARLLNLNKLLGAGVPRRRTNLGFDTPVGNTFIRGIHVFASQGIEALTCKCRREDASPPS